MRKLQASDIFSFCRLLKVLNLKEELKQMAKNATGADAWDTGFEVIYTVFEKATLEKSEQAVYAFLAGIFELDIKEIAQMDPVDLMAGITEAATPEKWRAFFTRAAGLMK